MTDSEGGDETAESGDGADPTPAALAERVRAGDLRLYELESHADADTATAARRRLVGSHEHSAFDGPASALETVGDYSFPASAAEPNIENMTGAVQIPAGVVGPVEIHGDQLTGERYVPMATTEGALLASVNRGCATIDRAGGATARVLDAGMSRAPVFRVDGVAEAKALVAWASDNEDRLRSAAESTTSHGELESITPYVVGNNVFLRFTYDTKDAMGMNMATIATGEACDVVEAETDADLIALSGNLCTDKKPAAIDAIEGRGRTVAADVTLPRAVVTETLDTTPEAVAEINTRKNHVGSAKAGSLGFNAHVANTVAAIFLATGQDAAQVVEGANAITTAEVVDGDLYTSVTLASLEVGTVGGGTKLPTQSEGLDVLGVRGGGDPPGANADALAEATAVAALAGELSLLSALASRNLSDAHAQLGR
ncbi:MAG: hydroxymethylglutaryl-CoA reductase (NADPH) [Halobaculum sp.]|jgi:hydroxymethylglutaryl-CoA reductase (NADPH)